MSRPAMRCGVSLSGRIVEALAVLEACEEDFRQAAEEVKSSQPGDDGAWAQLEAAADQVMGAANQTRVARSYLRGARLRGADVP